MVLYLWMDWDEPGKNLRFFFVTSRMRSFSLGGNNCFVLYPSPLS
jgi:hypothetical protein